MAKTKQSSKEYKTDLTRNVAWAGVGSLASQDKTNWHRTKGNTDYIYPHMHKVMGNRWKQSGQGRQSDQWETYKGKEQVT